jgi:hypothetical protein
MFVCFESQIAIFQLSGDSHHCWRQGCKFWPCLTLTAFSSEGSFTCHTYCDTGPPFLRSYPKDPWFYLLNVMLLAKEQSLPILNVLGLTRPARAGLELTTYRLLSESTTTRLRQPVYPHVRRFSGEDSRRFIWGIVRSRRSYSVSIISKFNNHSVEN